MPTSREQCHVGLLSARRFYYSLDAKLCNTKASLMKRLSLSGVHYKNMRTLDWNRYDDAFATLPPSFHCISKTTIIFVWSSNAQRFILLIVARCSNCERIFIFLYITYYYPWTDERDRTYYFNYSTTTNSVTIIVSHFGPTSFYIRMTSLITFLILNIM